MFRAAIPDATSTSEKFKPMNIGIVNTEEYSKDEYFKNAINSVSDAKSSQKMFNISLVSQNEAEDMLKNSKIEGYIIVKDNIKLVVKENGISQLIMKEFVDHYIQAKSQFEKIYVNNPMVFYDLIKKQVTDVNYIKEVSSDSTSKNNNSLNYYYALIGMTCLYGAFIGAKEIIDIEPNQSSKGARVSISPVNKLKLFSYSIFTATVIQILTIFLLIGYIAFVLRVDFGNKALLVLLTGVLGSLVGVSFGAMISSLIKGKEGLKISIIIGVSMILSFFAGLMYANMKYIIDKNVPLLAKLNPANLISDSFYSLYYYDTYTKYIQNSLTLLAMSVLFYIIVFIAMRRKKYASI
jgi:ABC-2 type transport system permease protein